MSGKRWFVDKHNYDGPQRETTQVGGGSKTPDKAAALKARMRRIDADRYGSHSYSIREGRK
ncbi:hypothetical protein [Paractinoplanes brasiliensis]|uniref:Uncharacterized protein n=1 Tax=Paractinoplanes brasiliensis TaxID=52695 RepID=A0A4R6JTP0_9ACTN|nr:hypothetical protein [Actinoplanes brasiliensis]TDO38396.1 hypothetical protein C8E87_2049 [Actinoplanes brasiliensis]GID26827.1 hypothetical protein Abr02nite_18100 [Actinoplanes brasiliensis]